MQTLNYGLKTGSSGAADHGKVTSDYWNSEERISNSKTRMTSGSTGLGWFAARPFFDLGYAFNKRARGNSLCRRVSRSLEDEEDEDHEHEEDEGTPPRFVDETFLWQNVRFDTGMRGLNFFFEEFKVSTNSAAGCTRSLRNNETRQHHLITSFLIYVQFLLNVNANI